LSQEPKSEYVEEWESVIIKKSEKKKKKTDKKDSYKTQANLISKLVIFLKQKNL